jgi:hypothetical protein
MTKLEKLLDRLRRNPGSGRFSELDRLLVDAGFTVRQPGGGSSHYIYSLGAQRLTIPRHRGLMPAHYVREAIAALGQVRELTDDDEQDLGQAPDGRRVPRIALSDQCRP